MARQESGRLPEKLELVATLDRTRASLSRDLGGMGRALDLSTQFRRSYAADWWKWLAGALGVGLIAGWGFVPPARKPRSTSTRPASAGGVNGSGSEAGPSAKAEDQATSRSRPIMGDLAGTLIRQLLFSAAQPVISQLLGQEIEKWLTRVLRKP
jgi:hypothetical protein